MPKLIEVAMPKPKFLLMASGLCAALLLPAPSAQASELVKLGKLLVTGKRAPATVELKPIVLPPARDAAAERSGERPAADGPSNTTAGNQPAPTVNPDWNEPRGADAPATSRGNDRGGERGAEHAVRQPAKPPLA